MKFSVQKVKNAKPCFRPRCEVCGKFKRLDNLIHEYTPDSAYSTEESYWICKKCGGYEDAIDLNK